MNYNTQNAKIASITEKTLIIGIDVGSETHYARAFSWRNYEYSKKPFAFSNDEIGFAAFKEWVNDIAEKHGMEVIIPGRTMRVIPVFDCSEEMTVSYNGIIYNLLKGKSKSPDLLLGEGDNTLIFTGNGTVSVDYRGGSL